MGLGRKAKKRKTTKIEGIYKSRWNKGEYAICITGLERIIGVNRGGWESWTPDFGVEVDGGRGVSRKYYYIL